MTEETDKIRSVVIGLLDPWSHPISNEAGDDLRGIDGVPLDLAAARIIEGLAKQGYAIVSEREWEAEGMSRRTWYRRKAEKK